LATTEEKEAILELIRHGLTPVQIEDRLQIPLKRIQQVRDEALLYYSQRLDDHNEFVTLRNFARLDDLYRLCSEFMVWQALDEDGNEKGEKVLNRLVLKTALDVIKVENQMIAEANKVRQSRNGGSDDKKKKGEPEFISTIISGSALWEDARDNMSLEDLSEVDQNMHLLPNSSGTTSDFDGIELESMLVGDPQPQEPSPDGILSKVTEELSQRIRDLELQLPENADHDDDPT
jgi:hypothetical protein